MLGAIIGDISGSRFDFNPTNMYHFEKLMIFLRLRILLYHLRDTQVEVGVRRILSLYIIIQKKPWMPELVVMWARP